MFRIIHACGLCDFPSIFQETTSYCEGVQDRTCYISHLREQNNAFFYSFVPSGATAWNHLTEQQF